LNQILKIVPVETEGRVKNIQIFRQDVSSAKSGDRIGVNLKGVDIKKIHRGCYATTNKDAFEYSNLIEIQVNTNSLFKPETHFGTQVHVTIGMFTAVGFIYPFNEIEGKRIRTDVKSRGKSFSAFLWLNEKVLMRKDKAIFLLSRLDLPPTTLRIMGTATLIRICKTYPKLYRYKSKTGSIQNPNHSQGIVCSGLARSLEGAKKIVGKDLEPPFSKIIGTFGTKGSVIIGLEVPKKDLSKGEKVVLKELRSFELKPKKDLNFQN